MSDEEGASGSQAAVGQFFRVRLWAVIGPPQSGKSTTIGHLAYSVPLTSGIRMAGGAMRTVMLRGGGFLAMFVVPQALQEYNQRMPVDAADWIESQARELQAQGPVISAGWFNVLIALRLDGVPVSAPVYPPAHEYLSYFVQRGWAIESLFLLNPPPAARDLYRRFGAPISYFDSASPENRQINFMAGAARNHFGWA